MNDDFDKKKKEQAGHDPHHNKISEVDPRAIDYDESTDVTQIHAAIAREYKEPIDGMEPVPLWLIAFCCLVLFLGGGYLMAFSGGFSSGAMGYKLTGGIGTIGGSDAEIGAEGEGGGGPKEITPELMVKLGQRFYSNCASCHQSTGLGAAGQYPPLAGSTSVTGSEERLVRVLLHGLKGPITVNGSLQNYSGNMVGWEQTLGHDRIAYVLTYIRQAWGNDAPAVMPETVKRIAEETKGRKDQWTEPELAEFPE